MWKRFSLSLMSRVNRKSIYMVSDQVRHKLRCTAMEDCNKLEILDLGRRRIVLFVVKTKVLISCEVTVQLICGFVYTYAKSSFSHDVALIMFCIL